MTETDPQTRRLGYARSAPSRHQAPGSIWALPSLLSANRQSYLRATGVTAYLKNGGTLGKAAQMANHASTRTTQLYDRRAEEVTLDEVERILV
jgi:hypothetical protein